MAHSHFPRQDLLQDSYARLMSKRPNSGLMSWQPSGTWRVLDLNILCQEGAQKIWDLNNAQCFLATGKKNHKMPLSLSFLGYEMKWIYIALLVAVNIQFEESRKEGPW